MNSNVPNSVAGVYQDEEVKAAVAILLERKENLANLQKLLDGAQSTWDEWRKPLVLKFTQSLFGNTLMDKINMYEQ